MFKYIQVVILLIPLGIICWISLIISLLAWDAEYMNHSFKLVDYNFKSLKD